MSHPGRNIYAVSCLLEEELGFTGRAMPDVNSQTTSYGSANARLNFSSGMYWTTNMPSGITDESFTEARLDDMAVPNLMGYYYAEPDFGTICRGEHNGVQLRS